MSDGPKRGDDAASGYGRGPVDCDQVLAEVYLFLDNECDEQRRTLIKAHLDDCSPCLRKFGIEQDVKALLARKCGGDRAPSSLRTNVRLMLSRVADESGVTETFVAETATEVTIDAPEA